MQKKRVKKTEPVLGIETVLKCSSPVSLRSPRSPRYPDAPLPLSQELDEPENENENESVIILSDFKQAPKCQTERKDVDLALTVMITMLEKIQKSGGFHFSESYELWRAIQVMNASVDQLFSHIKLLEESM